MGFEAIILEQKDGIATITLNRPKVFNSYSEQMSHELKEAVKEVGENTENRVLIIKGAGENFMAGADITMLNFWSKTADEKGWEAVKEILDNHFSPTLLEQLPIPVIAAVDGMAWGFGSEISLGCDFRICTNRASFAQPEINLGIIIGGGASQRLPRVVGKAKAMEIIMTGGPIKADDAYQWGLVNRVVAPEELDEAVAKLVKKIMQKSPLMIKWSKECVNLTLDHDLLSGIDKELTQFCKTFATDDSKEGTAAFLERENQILQVNRRYKMSLDMFKLDGKVAIVTGGSRGFGKAMALALADAGADVVVAARTKDALEEVAKEIEGKGRKALAIPTDMLDAASIEAMADKTFETFGKIDILINNAGQGNSCPFTKTAEETWDKILDINLKGYFLTTKAVGKYMVKAKAGRVINISSAMGTAPLGYMSPYAASKGGINAMTKSLAQEWAPLGITVNAIAPSYFDTDINKDNMEDEKTSKLLMSKTPIRRYGKVEELIGLVIYLSGDASSYMTGSIVALDGGWTAG